MPTKIYSYGVAAEMQVRQPRSENDPPARPLVEPTPRTEFTGQMKSGEEYYNALVLNENARRASIAQRRRELYPDYEALESRLAACNERVEEVVQEIRDYCRLNRTLKASDELKDKLKSVKLVRKTAAEAEKAMRKALWADAEFLAHTKEIDERTQNETKLIRKKTPLFWGSYQAIEEAVQAAKVKKRGGDLQTKRRFGEGMVAYHFQSTAPTMTWDLALSGADRRMRVWANPVQHPRKFQRKQTVLCGNEPFKFWGVERGQDGLLLAVISDVANDGSTTRTVPLEAISHPPSKHQRRWFCEFWLRTDEKTKKPIFVTVPFIRHRPLPEGAVIKWVKLHRYKLGTRWKYDLQFTATFQEAQKPIPDGTVAIDVGWRLRENGSVRVAYWVGSDDKHGEVVIKPEKVSAFFHGRSLQEIRDRRFDELRPQLVSFLANYPNLPQTHVDRFVNLSHWKSTQGMARACGWWIHHRIPGDEQIFALLDEFRRKEHHLYDWQSNERQKFQDWRKDFYRNLISNRKTGLAYQYGKVVIEKKFLAELSRKPAPGKDPVAADHAKTYKNVVSASILVQVIKEGFGERVVLIPAEYTTMTCYKCKKICCTGAELMHRCEHCGLVFDIDFGACKNLLDCAASGTVLNPPAEEPEI